jgi:gluconate 5-dehydrogenase
MDDDAMNSLESFNLAGRRALITGSSAGIGLALAQALGQAGAAVIINGRTQTKVEAAAQTLRGLGIEASAAVFDVTQAQAVRQAVDQLESQGPIDYRITPRLTGTRLCAPTSTACFMWDRPWPGP